MIVPGSGAAPQIQPLDPTDPQELGGYQLLGRIGSGGMGAVYLAETRTGRKLALKAILTEHVQDPEFRDRFRREVAAAMKVRGRFLATVIDADPDGAQPWLAVEYVEGPGLSAVVRTQGPLPEAEVRRLLAGVAEALRAVHQVGIVHRDLKPSNILLGQDGPFVIDFGIAQVSDTTSLTRTGLKVGTPAFMAPEQVRGSLATPAADVWALGAVALYAATGQRAFGEGDTTVVYYRVVHEEPDLTGCPEWLLPLVRACLAKDPADRPDLQEVLDFLNEVPAGLRTATTKIVPGPDVSDVDPLDDQTALRDDETVLKVTPAPATPEPEPEPAAPAKRRLSRTAAWLLAVGGVLVVGAAATAVVLGMLRPGVVGADPSASGAGEPSASPSPSVSVSASPSAEPPPPVDECLVGRWVQQDLTAQLPVGDETFETTGWNGRVVEYRADGTQVVRFDDAEPLRATTSAGEYIETWTGTATYTVSTDAGVLTFEDVDFGRTEVTRALGNESRTFEPQGLSQPLEYTCDATTHTQWAEDFEATFTRTD